MTLAMDDTEMVDEIDETDDEEENSGGDDDEDNDTDFGPEEDGEM